ncbi:hypothetical protein [Pseudophaeobacter sp. C1-32P7]|uniref:hypothetical protein n=1 Tax=Pseudophaeobacter sp. C1-32P7 TaxID=3098142 RepID=UPI0034D4A794
MPLLFPLSRNIFMGKLNRLITKARFEPQDQRQITGLTGGEILSAEVAPTYWEGSISLRPLDAYQASEIIPMLQALDSPGASFFAYDPDRSGPLYDPTGSGLAGYNPVVATYDAADSTVQISGLPDGYVISPNDLISWTYDGKYALHRFIEGKVVVAGSTGALQVGPHIRGTIAANEPAELVKPYCKAVIVPNSVNYGEKQQRMLHGVSFRFRQSLR